MPRGAVFLDSVIWLWEWRHVWRFKFRLIRRGVDFSEVGVKRQMLNFLLFEILRCVRFEWHTVVTHAFLAMPTHLFVSPSLYLAILLVQTVVELWLHYNFPRALDRSIRISLCERCDRRIFCGEYGGAIQSIWKVVWLGGRRRRRSRMTIRGRLFAVFEKELVSMATTFRQDPTWACSEYETYRRPTLSIGTPLRELSNLSSPPAGLFESEMERESASLGRLSRIWCCSLVEAAAVCAPSQQNILWRVE